MSKLKSHEIDEVVDTYIKCRSIAKTAQITGFCKGTVNKYVIDYSKQSKHSRNNIIPIVQSDLNCNYVKEYNSIAEASKFTGIPQPSIAQVLTGYIKQTHNFIFQYKKNYTQTIKKEL